MSKRLYYRDNSFIQWFRFKEKEAWFPHDAVAYFDSRLRCWFVIYRVNGRDYEGASFTDYPLAYERLVKNARGINIPPLETFYFYENYNKKFTSSIQYA